MANPVLLKNRSELIRHALRKLKNTKTRRVQEYVLEHFGIHVSQSLVCHERRKLTIGNENWRAERNTKILNMIVKNFGLDNLIEYLQELKEMEEENP